MMWRLAALILVLCAAWLAVGLWERRPVRSARQLASGLTLVTGAECRLCPLAVEATKGAGVPVTIVDVSDIDDPSIRSLPTALVSDGSGNVVARRSGRSAISAMPDLIAMARSVA